MNFGGGATNSNFDNKSEFPIYCRRKKVFYNFDFKYISHKTDSNNLF